MQEIDIVLTLYCTVSVLGRSRYFVHSSLFGPCPWSNYGCETNNQSVAFNHAFQETDNFVSTQENHKEEYTKNVFTLSVAEIPTGMIYADHLQKQHLQIQQTMQFESI